MMYHMSIAFELIAERLDSESREFEHRIIEILEHFCVFLFSLGKSFHEESRHIPSEWDHEEDSEEIECGMK